MAAPDFANRLRAAVEAGADQEACELLAQLQVTSGKRLGR